MVCPRPMEAKSPISLIGHDNGIGSGTFDSGAHCRGTTVRGLNIPAVDVIVAEDGTADRVDHDGPILDLQVDKCFGNQFMQDPMAATGTIMGGLLGTAAS